MNWQLRRVSLGEEKGNEGEEEDQRVVRKLKNLMLGLR